MTVASFTSDFVQFCDLLKAHNVPYAMNTGGHQNLFNAYNTFLLTCKYPNQKVREYRKNALVDYYAEINEMPDECLVDLQEIYKDNVKDTYDKKIIPSYPVADMQQEEYDDIKEHYAFIDAKYKYFADLVYRHNHPIDENHDDCMCDNYSEMDKESYLDDELYDNDSNDDIYEEGAYDEYDDDYYTDDDYY